MKEERTVTEENVGNRCRSQVPQEKRKVYKKAKKEVLLKEMLSLTEEEVLRASMKKKNIDEVQQRKHVKCNK